MEVCEQYRPSFGAGQAAKFAGGHRKDLFGFADALAFHPSMPVVIAVQITSRPQMTPHLRKYRDDYKVRQNIMCWLAQPGRQFVMHGWRKKKLPTKAGGTKVRWECEELEITLATLASGNKTR